MEKLENLRLLDDIVGLEEIASTDSRAFQDCSFVRDDLGDKTLANRPESIIL